MVEGSSSRPLFELTPDEPSVQANVGRLCLLFWFGSLREWKIGPRDNRRNQNPHWQIYLGPLSAIWWTY
jgi:hypothetical protein